MVQTRSKTAKARAEQAQIAAAALAVSSPFFKLPSEILELVFGHLPKSDLFRVRGVSKAFQACVEAFLERWIRTGPAELFCFVRIAGCQDHGRPLGGPDNGPLKLVRTGMKGGWICYELATATATPTQGVGGGPAQQQQQPEQPSNSNSHQPTPPQQRQQLQISRRHLAFHCSACWGSSPAGDVRMGLRVAELAPGDFEPIGDSTFDVKLDPTMEDEHVHFPQWGNHTELVPGRRSWRNPTEPFTRPEASLLDYQLVDVYLSPTERQMYNHHVPTNGLQDLAIAGAVLHTSEVASVLPTGLADWYRAKIASATGTEHAEPKVEDEEIKREEVKRAKKLIREEVRDVGGVAFSDVEDEDEDGEEFDDEVFW